jgi:hypothetical protein
VLGDDKDALIGTITAAEVIERIDKQLAARRQAGATDAEGAVQ